MTIYSSRRKPAWDKSTERWMPMPADQVAKYLPFRTPARVVLRPTIALRKINGKEAK